MNRQLTAKQLRELAAFHKKPSQQRIASKFTKARILDPEEAEKLNLGILTHYEIKRKRPPSERDSD